MKLSNTQVTAIAQQIEEEIKASNELYNKDIVDNTNKIVDDYLHEQPVLKAFVNQNGYSMNYVKTFIEKQHPGTFSGLTPKSMGYNTIDKIKRDVVLATIEETDVEAIINSIKAKYLA